MDCTVGPAAPLLCYVLLLTLRDQHTRHSFIESFMPLFASGLISRWKSLTDADAEEVHHHRRVPAAGGGGEAAVPRWAEHGAKNLSSVLGSGSLVLVVEVRNWGPCPIEGRL